MDTNMMNAQVDLLCEVIDVLYRRSSNGVFLNEIMFDFDASGTPVPTHSIEINQRLTDRCRMNLQLTEEFVYISMEYDFENDKDMLGMQYIFEQYLTKYTEAIKQNKPLAYDLFVQSYAVDNGYSYKVEARNPIFCYKDDCRLRFVFAMKDFKFGKTEFDFTDVDRELELARQEDFEQYEKECEEEAKETGKPNSFV